MSEKLSKARMSVREGANVNDVFNVFKDVVMEVATEIIGLKILKGRRGGSTWWTNEIKKAVEEKGVYKGV